MLTRIAVAVGVICLVFSAATFAQGFTQGDKTATLNGSGFSSDDFDNTTFAINGSLGYFFTSNIEGSVRQGLMFTDIEDGGSTWGGSTRVAGDYYFDYGRLWPFVGASLGVMYGDEDVEENWLFGLEGGVRYFVNSTTFLVGSIGFDWPLGSDDDDGAFDDGQWVYIVGMGFRW
jgi:hypothetical protein